MITRNTCKYYHWWNTLQLCSSLFGFKEIMSIAKYWQNEMFGM